jgi:hypothetical protein
MVIPERAALIWLTAFVCAPARAATELKIVTADGFVAFLAEDPWPVLAMQTKPPILMTVFQIPNPADDGTPDSTNLVIRFFEHGSAEAREGYAHVADAIGSSPPQPESFEGWTVYRQQGKQGAMEYSIVDAKRDLAGFSAAVRLAWPHSSRNPPDYPP